MDSSAFAPQCTLVPRHFFSPDTCAQTLSEVASLRPGVEVRYAEIPVYDAYLIYTISGGDETLPEIYHILKDLPNCREYNKILCSWKDGWLSLGIAEGKTLKLSNIFKAPDFVTAQYYVFLAMKSLQLNPEVSTLCLRTPIDSEEELSLYRYFKAVEFR